MMRNMPAVSHHPIVYRLLDSATHEWCSVLKNSQMMTERSSNHELCTYTHFVTVTFFVNLDTVEQ